MIKKIVSALLVLTLMLSFFCTASISVSAANETWGDWKYSVSSSGKATIQQYLGTDEVVSIPSDVNGHSVSTLGNMIFRNEAKNTVTEVIVPEGVKKTKNSFSGCKNLVSITLPDSLVSIGESAFEGCESLTDIKIPPRVTEIGDMAFSRCYSLTEIAIPEGVTIIEDQVFQGCKSLRSIVIPDSVQSIKNYAFTGCISLADITLPDGLTGLGYCAFQACMLLRSIVIPDGVTVIAQYAFKNCRSLTSVTLGSQVTAIFSKAFFDCINLKEIYIPPQVTEIEAKALGRCSTCDRTKEIIDEFNTDLVIKGAAGSAAERYAAETGLDFIEADEDTILYPDAPFIDPTFGIQYIRLPRNRSHLYEVRWNEAITVTLYAVSPQPVGSAKGKIKLDPYYNFTLLDSEICCASEEDGALMTGEIKDNGEFELHSTAADPGLFDGFLTE